MHKAGGGVSRLPAVTDLHAGLSRQSPANPTAQRQNPEIDGILVYFGSAQLTKEERLTKDEPLTRTE